MKRIISSILGSFIFAVASLASAVSVTPLAEYNIIVEGNYTHQAGSVYGKGLIGGNLEGGSPAEFASRVSTTLEVDSLTVLGDINNSVHVKTGNVVLGGSIDSNAHVDLQGSSASIRTANAADYVNFDSAIADIKDASAYYATQSSNTDYSVTEHSNNWDFSYSGTQSTAIFSGTVADIFKNNAQIGFDQVDADSLIINITDSIVNIGNNGWNMPGFDINGDNGLGAADILWNFYLAETVNISASTFIGSILAINADVTLNSTLEGAIAAKSLSTDRQIHNYNFEGEVNPVPLPGSLILFGMSLLAFGAYKRRA